MGCVKPGGADVAFLRVDTQAEVETVAALAHGIWNECYHDMLPQGQIDYMTEKFQNQAAIRKQMEEEGYVYFLARVGDENAGYLGVQPKDGRLFLSKIYFLAKFRGMGLAREAFAFLDGFARERSCGAVWLTVHKYNERAKAVYAKAGFALVDGIVMEIGNGYVMDDYVFERKVEAGEA